VTFIEMLVAMIASSVIIGAALVLYGTSVTVQRAHAHVLDGQAVRAAGEARIVALAQQIHLDPAAADRDDVRVLRDVPIAGVLQTVITYEVMRDYAAPLVAGTDYSLVEDATGDAVSGAVYMVQRQPIETSPSAVDPGDPAAPAQRFRDSRLLRVEVRAAESVSLGLPVPSVHRLDAARLGAFLTRPETWRMSETLATDAYRLTADDARGLAFVLQEYHAP
jgi:hypothetical protein